MISIEITEKFKDDLFLAQKFVREWANENGMNPEESEEKLESEISRIVKEIKTFPLSFASLPDTSFIKRARCFFDIYAVEYMIRPTLAKSIGEVESCLLGALFPLKSGRSQGINIPTDFFDFDEEDDQG
jgi:hypothetical protein